MDDIDRRAAILTRRARMMVNPLREDGFTPMEAAVVCLRAATFCVSCSQEGMDKKTEELLRSALEAFIADPDLNRGPADGG